MAMSEPIHLLFVAATAETGARFHPRNLIVAQRHSQVKVIETYVPITGAAYCTNTVTELVLGEGATVEHCRVQNESQGAFHIAAVQAHQGRGSRFISHSISLGARLARQDIRSVLDGEWSDCLMNGLYLGEAGQLVDHHTVMDHSKPRCASNEHYHGILAGRAQGVFNGKILVRQEAQKTAAKQTNRNVLLSDEAVINTKPQLEIFADDVKCAHGATVGQLDEEAIFYLQSRGLGADQARLMLLRAFASQILDRVQCEPARAQIEQHVWDRLQTMV
jgi:Fe-S cluster assembly protein SufD